MARQADHDVDLFTELVRSGKFSKTLEVPRKKAKSGSEMKDAESKPDDLGKRSLL
jgi:hypothetical protein